MQAFIDKDHPQHSRYNTVSRTVRHTIQDEGAGALLKGVGPRALRITCTLATSHAMRHTSMFGLCTVTASCQEILGKPAWFSLEGIRVTNSLFLGVHWTAYVFICAGAVFILTFCRNELSPYYLQGKNAVFGIKEELS